MRFWLSLSIRRRDDNANKSGIETFSFCFPSYFFQARGEKKEHQIYSSIRETLSCGSTRVWRNTNNRQFAGWISKRDTSSAASMFGSMWRNKNECNIFINVEACLRRRKFDYLLFCQQKNFLKRWMNPRRCERLAQRKVFFSLAKKKITEQDEEAIFMSHRKCLKCSLGQLRLSPS